MRSEVFMIARLPYQLSDAYNQWHWCLSSKKSVQEYKMDCEPTTCVDDEVVKQESSRLY